MIFQHYFIYQKQFVLIFILDKNNNPARDEYTQNPCFHGHFIFAMQIIQTFLK